MFRMILFDVDGVLLSEERCFDSSALTVWELLFNPGYLGLAGDSFTVTPDDERIRQIRRNIFQEDRVLNWLKERGTNSNWDMVFLVFSTHLLDLLRKVQPVRPELVGRLLNPTAEVSVLRELGDVLKEEKLSYTPKYERFLEAFSHTSAQKQDLLLYLNELAQRWLGMETSFFSKQSSWWEWGRSVYQEWYLGDEQFQKTEGMAPRTEGKAGFLHQEIPLAEPAAIRRVLDEARQRGAVLGIGTGRPALEAEVPLQALGLLSAFDPDRVVTASDVIRAEEAFPERAPLGKPQPFTFVKGYFGKQSSDAHCVEVSLPLSNTDDVLVVGDSVADLLAARKMGCRFAATLTGLTGEKARATFEKLEADYILDDVTQLSRIFS